MQNVWQFLVGFLAAAGDTPDLAPIGDTIKAWSTTFVAFLGYVGGAVAAVFFVLQALKLMKAEDANERHTIKVHMFWIALGCVVSSGGAVVAQVFASAFFKSS